VARLDESSSLNPITSQELEFGKLKLHSLNRSGSLNNMFNSGSNLMDKIKRTFKSKLHQEDTDL
jgi:hypothetical protein